MKSLSPSSWEPTRDWGALGAGSPSTQSDSSRGQQPSRLCICGHHLACPRPQIVDWEPCSFISLGAFSHQEPQPLHKQFQSLEGCRGLKMG